MTVTLAPYISRSTIEKIPFFRYIPPGLPLHMGCDATQSVVLHACIYCNRSISPFSCPCHHKLLPQAHHWYLSMPSFSGSHNYNHHHHNFNSVCPRSTFLYQAIKILLLQVETKGPGWAFNTRIKVLLPKNVGQNYWLG